MVAKGSLPEDVRLFSLSEFKGLNTKAKRPGIDDEEFSWIENFFPIGPNNLRTLYGPSAPSYTTSGGLTVAFFYLFNIGATNYVFVNLSNGSCIAVNLATMAVTTLCGPGTITTPYCAQWGNQYLLIISPNGYFIWSGTTFYTPGSTGPNGNVMPTGLVGTYIETFQSRVWTINGSVCTYSAPALVDNFATSAGGGSFTSTDSFLRTAFFGVKQAAGFLYLFGDSSINVISNVQTTGSTPTTTFNNSNTDPQTGTSWPLTIQAFGRALIFANQSGVYALYGGSAEKVSDNLDGVFAAGDFVTLVPSAAIVTIFGIKCYAIQILTMDPSGVKRPIIFLWDGKKWFGASQGTNSIIALATQQATSAENLWVSDGTNIFQCLTTASATLKKQFSGKLWKATDFIFIKRSLRAGLFTADNSNSVYTFIVSVDNEIGGQPTTLSGNSAFLWFNNAGTPFVWFNGSGSLFSWITIGFAFTASDVVNAGRYLGISLSTTAQDITVIAASLEYDEETPW